MLRDTTARGAVGRPLAADEWAAARALLHRAFVIEPFVIEMYGQPLLSRWCGSWDLYWSVRSEESTIALGARVGEVLVGVVMGSTPGQCRLSVAGARATARQ